MSKFECRKKLECRSSKGSSAHERLSSFGIRHSFVIRISTFELTQAGRLSLRGVVAILGRDLFERPTASSAMTAKQRLKNQLLAARDYSRSLLTDISTPEQW